MSNAVFMKKVLIGFSSLVLAGWIAAVDAKGKEDGGMSTTGHGQAVDARLGRNSQFPEGCSSPAQTTTNASTGRTTASCRGLDGNMRDIPDGGTPGGDGGSKGGGKK